ncbi:hypothetical protein ACFYPC_09025 [Streptomyces sp. NPDC005808]|uniref:hypothetical protein n=1 Tax=Streptomyces sp. NPDC005808 TaxID=3364734 RepID=UPI0036A49141
MTTENSSQLTVQRSAIQVLADLTVEHPELPAAYITIRAPWQGEPSRLDLQLDTPTEFEQWRTALGIPSADVVLEPYGRGSWVTVHTVHEGISVTLSAHGILITQDMLTAPRTVDAVEVSA